MNDAALDYSGGLTVSMSVSEMDKAIKWYESNLDFELLYKMDDIGWCELKSPVEKVNVGLSEVENPVVGGQTPTFGVRDIEAAKANLDAKGVRIDGDIVTIEGMVSLLTFYDQDNNALMFYQDLTGNE